MATETVESTSASSSGTVEQGCLCQPLDALAPWISKGLRLRRRGFGPDRVPKSTRSTRAKNLSGRPGEHRVNGSCVTKTSKPENRCLPESSFVRVEAFCADRLHSRENSKMATGGGKGTFREATERASGSASAGTKNSSTESDATAAAPTSLYPHCSELPRSSAEDAEAKTASKGLLHTPAQLLRDGSEAGSKFRRCRLTRFSTRHSKIETIPPWPGPEAGSRGRWGRDCCEDTSVRGSNLARVQRSPPAAPERVPAIRLLRSECSDRRKSLGVRSSTNSTLKRTCA